jgi:hypothetical protein
MPYSKQTFTYSGGARTFTISLALGYIKEADIQVYVDGELGGGGEQLYRTFTFDSEFVVNVTEALDNPSTVTVERTVDPDVFEIDFEAGDDITNRNVMIAFRQNFHLMQEILDGRVDGVDIDQRATDAETFATASAASAAAAAASAAILDVDEVITRDGAVDFIANITGIAPISDLHLATKKYVDDSVGGGGVMLLDGSQQMTGLMSLKAATAPTADDHASNKKYVDDQITGAGHAPTASPTLTGVPLAPTAAPATNNTQIATTAYADAAAGIGMVAITTASPSASASVEFTGLSAYIALLVVFEDVDATGDINLTMSNDDGVSYLTSYVYWEVTDGGDTGAATTSIKIKLGDLDLNFAAMINATHTTGKAHVMAVVDGDTGSPAGNVYVRGGFVQSTTEIDAIKLTPSAGTLSNGTVRLFGIKG